MHRVGPGTHQSTKQLSTAEYWKTVLPSGIRVVTESIAHVRSVSVGIWFDVGSRDEISEQSGISHFIEHMVFKGTKNYRLRQIAQSLESVGGYLNAFTSKEQTCFYARCLDRHLEKAVSVLSDMVQFPLFEPAELEKEKQVVLEELKNIEDDPDDLIHDYFDKAIYGNHPLAFPVIGTVKSIMAMKRPMLIDYMRRHHTPASMVIAAAGHITHDVMVSLIKRYFQGVPSSRHNGTVSRLRAPNRPAVPAAQDYERPITQAHICMGTLGLSVKHRQRYSLLVLNTLLGEGMSSRLFQNIRERYGLAYTVYSFANTLSDTGTFGVYAGTDKKNVQNCIELIYKEMEKMKSRPVSMAELRRTKEQLKGTMMLSLESMSSRMMRLGSGELVFGEYVPLDDIIRNINGVTQDELTNVALKLFTTPNFSVITILPTEKQQIAEQALSVSA